MAKVHREAPPLVVELGRGSDVTLADLSRASAIFSDLLDAVGRDVTLQSRPFDWIVTVHAGSVITEMRPEARTDVDVVVGNEVADTVVRGVAAMLAREALPLGFTPDAAKVASRLRDVVNHGTSLTVATPRHRVAVTSAIASYDKPLAVTPDYLGSVTGRLEAVNIHGNPRFTVWDEWGNRIQCSIRADMSVEGVARAVGERVVVYGVIKPQQDGGVAVTAQRIAVLSGDVSAADDLPAVFRGADTSDW